MTASRIGVSAGGVVGALLAVPLVDAAEVAYLELRPPALALPDPLTEAADAPVPT